MKSLFAAGALALALAGFTAAPAQAAVAPTLSAANSFPVVQGATGPLGDVLLTESAPGQFQVGDVLTYRFSDAGAATLHFATAGTVGGTNGLAGTVAVASSSGTLNDEMKVTITSASSGTFPGVLTLAGLNAAVDGVAVIGAVTVAVTDSNATTPTPSPSTVSDATVISSGTSRAIYGASTTPTILSTTNNQAVGSVTITEPAKDFFKTGDVITFTLRDANGSADTIGLTGAPISSGGSMAVSVSGSSGSAVQVNDTSFAVNIVSQDPSNGSTSTLTVSNIAVNTAQAPLGPVTLSAVVTTGAGAGSELIAPGRVTVANVGGNTSTTSVSRPVLAANTANQAAGNLSISLAAGSLLHADTFSLTLQTPGVVFNATNPPLATVTSGGLTLTNAGSTLNQTGTTATWTVQNGNLTASTITVGPIYYDVANTVASGTSVSVLASGASGSAFTPQVVTNAVISPVDPVGTFAAVQPLPVVNVAPFTGANVTYTESSTGSTPAGSSIVLLSPYATQIAAFRTTFASVPTVSAATNGMTLGTPTVNSSALVVNTPDGPITAPAQTLVSIPVTAGSSSGPASFTISGITFKLGTLVAPGALTVSGVVRSAGGVSLDGNQVVDFIDTYNLGTSTATTPPNVTFTETPAALTGDNNADFAFVSDQGETTFACALDAHVISLKCPSPISLPSLTDGTHSFTVQGFNASQIASAPVTFTWTIDHTPPTATATFPTDLVSPINVVFSKPVTNVSVSTVTLANTPAGLVPAVPLTATLTCSSDTVPAEACSQTGSYTTLAIQPSAPLVPGEQYVVTLNPEGVSPQIQDAAGNVLASVALPFTAQQSVQDGAVGTTATWKSVNNAGANGGSYVTSHEKGATATFTFSGTGVIWQTVTGPNQGQAIVSIDGVAQPTVNNYTKTVHYKVQRSITGLVDGPHTLKIVVRGLKGASTATDSLVSIDAFVVNAVVSQQTAATYAWKTVAAAGANGGTYAIEDLTGASYSVTFRGTSVRWYTVYGPAMGKANLYVDGVLKGTFSHYAKALTYGKAHAVTGLLDGVHTVKIVVLGSKVTAATGTGIAVDRIVAS